MTGLPVTPEIRRLRERGVLDRLPMFDRITPTGWPGRMGVSCRRT
ncbi:hypothetical protein NKG94_27925 [Micromonospora sp. M12]